MVTNFADAEISLKSIRAISYLVCFLEDTAQLLANLAAIEAKKNAAIVVPVTMSKQTEQVDTCISFRADLGIL